MAIWKLRPIASGPKGLFFLSTGIPASWL